MPEYIQVNVNITEEDGQRLDQMIVEDAYDNRSAWVRRLIRQEWLRRSPQTTVLQPEVFAPVEETEPQSTGK